MLQCGNLHSKIILDFHTIPNKGSQVINSPASTLRAKGTEK